MHKLRFRQVHLDFHTSPAIGNIGSEFNKQQWQEALKIGHVDSITCFATGHHGWSYYDTKIGERHPNLGFDLLRLQFDAAKEIDVNVPVYLTAGVHNVIAKEHPEWREMGSDGKYRGWTSDVLTAGFHSLCFNTPYLDYLCSQIEEVVTLYPNADGIFLDIISQGQCCCKWCMESMAKNELDPTCEEDRIAHAELVLDKYYARTTAAARVHDDEMPIFHNSGHISMGNRDILKYFSHLELESLPTGGWGYDHFPVSAKYCHKLPLDFLGMTGKFHTTWGEFGGYKHPNALRYECAAMLAFGAKCSVGDQLHPSGVMDISTYNLIGAAYAEVEKKEPWCIDIDSVADIGLFSSASINSSKEHDNPADTGAGRILLEGHFLFDILDAEMDFSPYKLLILPDDIQIDNELKLKLDLYIDNGGKLLLTGKSGLSQTGDKFLFDVGATMHGQSEYQPDYILPIKDLRPSFVESPLVMYLPSQRIKATSGESLGDIYDPYFNRNYKHFCSHQHAPAKSSPSEYDCGVRNGNIMYLAHPVFTIYRGWGAVAYKEYIINAINLMLDKPTVEISLPSTGRVSLMWQSEYNRYILHLLYANTIQRGGAIKLSGGNLSRETTGVEVIDDIIPLHNVAVSVEVEQPIKSVRSVPDGVDLDFSQSDNRVEFTLPELECHQMIELQCL